MSNFIKKQIALYKNLNFCYCPSLQETVHFTADGLNHLLYNRRRPRNYNERHYRAGLINYLVEIITNSTLVEKKIISTEPKIIVIWSLKYEIIIKGQKTIAKVILIKKGTSQVTFLSAMSRKLTKKT